MVPVRQPLGAVVSAVVFLAVGAAPALGVAGNITTVAGPGTAGTPGDGGPASQAYVGSPVGVTALPDGGYLIAHQGSPAIRRVLPDGTITTIAGNGVAGFSGDGGPATMASLNAPAAAIPTPDGGYLIADPNNNAVRRVAPDGTISTAAGVPLSGAGFTGDNGPASSAQLSFPYDVAVQADGGYLIADTNNNRIRRVDPDGTIHTVAGGGSSLGDNGPATSAVLFHPSGVKLTADGGYLIADTDQDRIRKVAPDGAITTVAGNGTRGDTGDGGPATAATLGRPVRAVPEADGGFLVVEDAGARVRRVAPDGTITTVAGTTTGFGGDDGPATGAQFNRPLGVAELAGGDIIIADGNNNRVRSVDEAPPAPVLTGSLPVSPASDNTPRVTGVAPPGTTVALFTNNLCAAPSAAGGTAAEFDSPGISVPVPDNSTTTIRAVAIDDSGNRSFCSTSSVTYVHQAAVLPPPVRGVTVNAVPKKGTVLVKVPGKQGFVPLESLGRHLPVGSTLDTRKGEVRLTTAGKTKGKTQFGRFSKGVFKFTQTKKSPLTTLSMTGGGLTGCETKRPSGGSPKVATEARKRRRTLFSNVRGRFRTRGRNSTATVRGTQWTMTDTCAGTLTTVKSGSVRVRDLRKGKTRLVKAGHSYFARSASLRKKPQRHRR